MKFSYHPHIDGLRAIAVMSVIFYHSKIFIFDKKIFTGGFIGVDIFFVISGYLITSIILKELISSEKFSFKLFYERRIRRIIPVLLFIIFVSMPFAYYILLPNSLLDFSKSILYSLGFSSNIYFHYSGQQYGAENAILSPFLHTWSLSVEEQFYILFPFILFIIHKFFRKHLIKILIFTFFTSLIIADWGSRYHASFNFYIIFTRAWELLAGSIISYFFNIKKIQIIKYEIINSILASIGLILILYSIFFFHEGIRHPSLFTLLPVIGTCLIIVFPNSQGYINKILTSKIIVNIGLISYSLYLWHYPIFAFFRINEQNEENIIYKLLLIVITFILSILTYYFIEKPARNKNLKFKYLLAILATFIIIIISFSLISIFKEGLKNRPHFSVLLKNELKNLNYREIKQNKIYCHDRNDVNFCIFNELDNNNGDIILLGDSMTDSLLGNLIEEILKTKFRLIHMSYSGNLYLPEVLAYNKITNKIENDETWHENRKKFLNLKTNKNTYVIIFGDYNYYYLEKRLKFHNKEIIEYETPMAFVERKYLNLKFEDRKKIFEKKIIKTINELSKNKKILLIYPTPISPTNILNNIVKKNKKIFLDNYYYLSDEVNYQKKIYVRYNSKITNLFDSIKSKNVYKIKTENIFCPKEKCIFYDNQNIYFSDTIHLSYEGSKKINNLILRKIKEIELNLK